MQSNRRNGQRGRLGWLLSTVLACSWSFAPAHAWHTENHQRITRVAVDCLPDPDREMLGSATDGLVEEYCMYPDRYRSAVSSEDSEWRGQMARMKPYVQLPLLRDLGGLHGIDDDDSELCCFVVATLMDAAVKQLRAGAQEEAAQYLGTLAHFVEDSASPVHTVDNGLLRQLLPPPEQMLPFMLHERVEKPTFPLDVPGYSPEVLGKSIVEAAAAFYPRYRENRLTARAQAVPILQAIYAGDEEKAAKARANAAAPAAKLLADVIHTVCMLARDAE